MGICAYFSHKGINKGSVTDVWQEELASPFIPKVFSRVEVIEDFQLNAPRRHMSRGTATPEQVRAF